MGSLPRPSFHSDKVVTYEATTRLALLTNADGDLMFLMQPGSLAYLMREATLVGGVVTGFSSWGTTTGYSSIEPVAENKTVVSSTIEVNYIGSTFNNQGRLSLKGWRTHEDADTSAISENPGSYGDITAVNFYTALKKGGVIIPTPSEERAYFPRTLATTSKEDQRGWGRYCVFITGAEPSTRVVEVVIKQQIELQPKENSFLSHTAKAGPPADPDANARTASAYTSLIQEGMSVAAGTLNEYVQQVTPDLQRFFWDRAYELAGSAGLGAVTTGMVMHHRNRLTH